RMLFALAQSVRTRKPNGDLISTESTRRRGASENPFFSASPDSLARFGYVHLSREITDSTIFYAPDAKVLLSESFVATHCLRTRTGDARHPRDVGLVFEPSSGRRAGVDGALHADVRGVLWVDGGTSELRTLEFTYTGLPHGVSESHANGRVDFLRLAGGAVVVREWVVRAPEMQEIREGLAMPTAAAMTVKVVGLRETSGEILEASMLDGRALWRAQGATLAGVVVDSERLTPVPGAVVGIAGTAYRSVTDADGRWRLDGLPSGSHNLFLSARLLDVLGVPPVTHIVTLRDGATDTLRLALPGATALIARACRDTLRAKTTSVVAGTARDSISGAALPGATVRVWSAAQTMTTVGRLTRPLFEAEFVTDSTGAFHICGAPNNATLGLRARLGNRRSGMSSVETEQMSIVIQDALVGKRVAIVSP
ncbi:MAG: carboxypeptidase-like regulatory domain-containing protein, partial [Gemmatimonadota bacterium]|nr:carboxypeptidase-like regulatory domain-containing protein [Gemmatimonadota bacterium]